MSLCLVIGLLVCITQTLSGKNVDVIQGSLPKLKEIPEIADTVCPPPNIEKSFLSTENDTFYVQDTVEVECEYGYRFPRSKSSFIQVECQPNGSWLDVLTHQSLPQCERIGSCPVPKIQYGEVLSKPGGYMPGDLAPFRCHGSQQQYIICLNDGTWEPLPGGPFVDNCTAVLKNCSLPPMIEHGGYHIYSMDDVSTGVVPEGTKVVYYCIKGYTIANKTYSLMTCENAAWKGVRPECVVKKNNSVCQKPTTVPNSYYSLYPGPSDVMNQGGHFSEGTSVKYSCETGFKLYGEARRTCIGDKWTGRPPSCIPGCGAPPNILHAKYNFFGQRTRNRDGHTERIAEDSSIYYFCDNGYRMRERSVSPLRCIGGAWNGTRPVCEKRTECDTPMDIPHGNWIILSSYADFRIGSRVEYECDEGYKAIGEQTVECQSTGYWSDNAPKCLPSDQYCSEPQPVENGFYMCKPNHCNTFSVGTEVHYMCSKHYSARRGSVSVQTCKEGGEWSHANPVCLKDSDVDANGGLMFTSNTLIVVIVTSCTVLGLLIIVMIIVIIQRKSRPHRNHYLQQVHAGSQPLHHPAYERAQEARVVPAIDEHDRVALIAFADGVQVVLPSYEESIRSGSASRSLHHGSGGRLHRYNSDSSRSSLRSTSTARGEYRPLPTIPYSVRHAAFLRDLPVDQRDHYRNSIITTTSSAVRGGDNLSVTFGSLDTVNISDNTSTTVTLGTYDSGASNPSLTLSQRGVTGSLASSNSNPSLATEDAPLLEQTESVILRSQTASPSIAEEMEECIDELHQK